MRGIVSLLICLIFSTTAVAQLSTLRVSGGSVITKLESGASINPGSTLTREWIILNDKRCPIELNNKVGINAKYLNTRYRFEPVGSVIPSEAIVAFEIHHVLYNVFGGHIKTLKNLKVLDLNGQMEMNGSEDQLTEYLTCVSFIATVRTANGDIWKYNPTAIKEELSKIEVQYEEGYRPLTRTEE